MLCLSDLIQSALIRYGDATALIVEEVKYSYRDLDSRSATLAAFLQAKGIGSGDKVALHLRNGLEYVIADLAILKLGAVKVPLNELMAAAELAFCLQHSGAVVLIAHASLVLPADGLLDLRVLLSVADAEVLERSDWESWQLAMAAAKPFQRGSVTRPDDMAMIAYTGGTTGRAKGVHHSQHRLAINLFAHIICGDIRSDEVMLLSTPLPHSAGYHLQACLVQGGAVVLGPRFEPESLVKLVQKHQATWLFAVPTMLYRLFDRLAAGTPVPSSIRTILYGAAPMSRARLVEGLGYFGTVFIQLFGQTECPNFITTLSKSDHLNDALLASCGRPVVLANVRIMGGNGQPTEVGAVGEVEVLSPYVLIEYFRDPETTAAAFNKGWLRTGDLGYLDRNNYLYLVDRAKDMIITGGMNVYSVDVESALRRHSAILDVAVLGMPDPDWGEAVVAFVTTRTRMSEAEVQAFAKLELSAYKAPKRIYFVDNLPVTPYGKVDKKALRSRLASI